MEWQPGTRLAVRAGMPKHAAAKRLPATAGVVPAPWRTFVVACRKCGKRLDGGYGPDGDETLRRAVKQALRQAGRRGTLHVVETGCLSLCPKGGVAVLRADRPGELHVIPAGLDGPELLAALGDDLPATPPQAPAVRRGNGLDTPTPLGT